MRNKNMTHRTILRRVFSVILLILSLYIIILGVLELPPYGAPDNPVHNYVAQRYIEDALEDTGVLNMVTAIIVDYRAYDTLIETTVLFTAIMAVMITLKKDPSKN